MMGFGNHGFGMGGGGGFFMVIFWVAVIAAVVLGVRYLTGNSKSSGPAPPGDPLDILRERYARGEISTQEYQERREVLERGSGGA